MLTEDEVRARLRAAIDAAGGQGRFAKAHQFTPAYVNDIVHGRRPMADRILATIGVKRTTIYEIDSQIESRGNQKAPDADASEAS